MCFSQTKMQRKLTFTVDAPLNPNKHCYTKRTVNLGSRSIQSLVCWAGNAYEPDVGFSAWQTDIFLFEIMYKVPWAQLNKLISYDRFLGSRKASSGIT